MIANYLGILLGFVNVLIFMPAVFEAEQIGLINLILSIAFIIYPFMDFSASALLNRYFSNYGSPQKMFHFSGMLMLIGAVTFFFVFLFGKPWFEAYYIEKSPEVIPYMWFIFGLCIVLCWLILLENYAIVHQKLHISTFFKEVLFRILVSGMILLFFLKIIPFEKYIFLHFGMYLFVATLLLLYLFKKGFLRFAWSWPKLSKRQYLGMGQYGSYVLLTGMAGVLATRIDTVMLGSILGLKDVGIYTIALYMTSVIDVPRRMVTQASFPIIRTAVKEGDFKNVEKIQQKSVLNLVLICGIILTIILMNVEDIYKIIPRGSVYEDGAWVVLFLGLAKLVDVSNGVNYEIFLASKYYRYTMLFFVVMAISAVGFNYLFIPLYGIQGAALGTMLATLVLAFIKMALFKKFFGLKSYGMELILVLLFLSFTGVVCYFLPLPFHVIIAIGIRSSLASLMIFFFLKFSKVSPDLNNLINSILAKIPLLNKISI